MFISFVYFYYRSLVNVPCKICWRESQFRATIQVQFLPDREPSDIKYHPSYTSILTPSLVESTYLGSIQRDHDHQQVSVGAVRGEHGALATDLAPVPARAGLAQPPEVDRVLGAELSLKRDGLVFIFN